ncbi:MAG TPA: PAS domain S-box protein, partial [Chitinophagaceae bacterium]|nr:PAS domain S-box protein [Chitinophagaceae bacterium]
MKQQETPSIDEQLNRKLYLLLDDRLWVLSGYWDWSIPADALFCSNRMISLPDPVAMPQVRCLLHPDDVEGLRAQFSRFTDDVPAEAFGFRVITTYGTVCPVRGEGFYRVEPLPDPAEMFREKTLDQFRREKETVNRQEETGFRAGIYQYAERIFVFGIYSVNAVHLTSWYSDNYFRIFGLPPQSLNPHPNTFNRFIHADDLETVSDALDKAFQYKLPLHLEFRIIRADKKLRHVRYTADWTFNAQGEPVMTGTLADITENQLLESEYTQQQQSGTLQRSLLNMVESESSTGTWYLNLFTRESHYSDQVYRMYGLRPQMLLTGMTKFAAFIYPEDLALYTELYQRIWNEHAAPDLVYRIIRQDGKIRYLRQKGKVEINANEELVVTGTIRDITGQKYLEEKISVLKEQQILHQFLHRETDLAAGMGHWLWDLTSGEVQWSDSLYRLLGLKPQIMELNMKRLRAYIHPEDYKLFQKQVQLVVEEQTESEFYFRVLHKSASRRLRALFRMLSHEDKEFFVGIVQDVTEEQKIREQLTERAQFAEQLSDAIPDRVFVTCTENTILAWNRSSAEGFALKKEEVLGENIFSVLPHLKTPEIADILQKALSGKTMYLPVLKDSVTGQFFELLASPVYDAAGSVSGVLHVLHNISQEHSLREQLTSRVTFIESLLEHSLDRIVVLDRHMNYLYWNKRSEAYYGLFKENVLGKNILEIFPAFRNDPSYIEFKRALKGETVHLASDRYPDQPDHFTETYLIPLKDDLQQVTGILWIVHDLSKEFQLERQKKKAAGLIEALNEGYLELDAGLRLVYCNQKAKDLLQLPEGDPGKQPLPDLFPQEKGSAFFDALRRAQEEQVILRAEFEAPGQGGWIYCSIAPQHDGLVVMVIDIQQLKNAEQQLSMQNEIYSYAEQIGRIGTWAFNISTGATLFSDQFYRLIGLSPEDKNRELKTLLNSVHPSDREKVKEAVSNLLAYREMEPVELRLAGPEDSVRYFVNRSKIIRALNGDELFIGTLQEVTEDRQLRRQLDERVRESEELIDASTDRIMVLDHTLHFTGWNRKCSEIYRFQKEEVMGRSLFEVFPQIRQHDETMQAFEEARSGRQAFLPAMRDLYTNLYNELFLTPLRDEAGSVRGILVIIHDITRRVMDEMQLRELNLTLENKNIELEEKNAEITNFSFVASHDLREPLRKIHTF